MKIFKKIKDKCSEFIDKHSNFIGGAGSVIDISGQSSKIHDNNEFLKKTGEEMTAEDWKKVCDGIWSAIYKYDKTTSQKVKDIEDYFVKAKRQYDKKH